jgi:hypothetical protein
MVVILLVMVIESMERRMVMLGRKHVFRPLLYTGHSRLVV